MLLLFEVLAFPTEVFSEMDLVLPRQVLADEKGRMSMIRDQVDEGLLIRANQGHSMEGVIVEEQLLTRIDRAEDVPVCVHGTSLANWSR